MRAGWAISAVGHVGAVLMTALAAWQAHPIAVPESARIVPIDVVDISAVTNVKALAPPVPEVEEEVTPDEGSPEVAQEEAAEAPPEPTPQRPQPRRELDLAELSKELMKNTEAPPRPRRAEGEASNRRQERAGAGTANEGELTDLAASIVARHLRRCWREPVDLPNPERLIVTVEFELDGEGYLKGQPRVISPTNYSFDPPMRTAVEASLRALRVCEPFPFPTVDQLEGHYSVWARNVYTFRPGM